MNADQIVNRAARVMADARRLRNSQPPLTLYDEALLDARAVLAEIAPLLEAKALANCPDGTHCRSCCFLEAPCDEHKEDCKEKP